MKVELSDPHMHAARSPRRVCLAAIFQPRNCLDNKISQCQELRLPLSLENPASLAGTKGSKKSVDSERLNFSSLFQSTRVAQFIAKKKKKNHSRLAPSTAHFLIALDELSRLTNQNEHRPTTSLSVEAERFAMHSASTLHSGYAARQHGTMPCLKEKGQLETAMAKMRVAWTDTAAFVAKVATPNDRARDKERSSVPLPQKHTEVSASFKIIIFCTATLLLGSEFGATCQNVSRPSDKLDVSTSNKENKCLTINPCQSRRNHDSYVRHWIFIHWL